MEHKQFTSDDLNHSLHSNQGFLSDRFSKKLNNLNIPDTIPENCSAELNESILKMEASKAAIENFSNEDKENLSINLQVNCNESLNSSANISIDNSYLKQCEKKLLESSNSEDDKNAESDKNIITKGFIRRLIYHDDTISTPPSLLRKEISLLRNEMTEAHEFHDFEIQVLKEEKLNEADSCNYLELFEKYSTLMELYTTLKAEYDEYRKEQEKIRQEYQSKTADCLEFLCSQIEASDNSLNFSSASFVSFNGGIKSSTMMEDVSEVETTVVNDATVLTNDPLSITNDVVFKTPMQTPLKTAKKLVEEEMNSAITKPVLKEVKDVIAKHETTISLDSEDNIRLLNLEAALYDKVKEAKDLEHRLFKLEDLSSVLQNEFERISSVYAKENNALKESLSKTSQQLNELTQKLLMETVSLNPSLRDSLSDISGMKLLIIFIETIMESCKKIQSEEITKHSAEKADWEAKRKSELMTIKELQNQASLHLAELDNFKKKCENLEVKLRDADSIILTRDEEIQMLQSQVSTLRESMESFSSVRNALSESESRLTLTEAEKKAAEIRCRELEVAIENLDQEIEMSRKLSLELQAQLLTSEEKKSEIESDSVRLKQLYDTLKDQVKEIEDVQKSKEFEVLMVKENLASANETILKLKSQLQSAETEKRDLKNRYAELQEDNQHLRIEINSTKTLEIINERILNEKDDLEQKILEKEEIMAELKTELDFAKEKQVNNFHRVEELKKEIEDLKKENSAFLENLDAVEENQKNLVDLLLSDDNKNDNDLPSDRITNLIETSLKLQDPAETRETKITSVFIKTIMKICKEVQNNLIKHYDNKKLEWDSQRDDDLNLIISLQNQVKCLTEKCVQNEAKVFDINNEKKNLIELLENLKIEMTEAEKTISICKDEIKILKSKEDVLEQIKNDLDTADKTIIELKSQILSFSSEKAEFENRYRKLEENVSSLQSEIETKQTITKELDELKIIREKIENENSDLKQQIILLNKNLEIEIKENFLTEFETQKSEIKMENEKLKESYDTLKIQMTEAENVIFIKDEEIRLLKSYKSELATVKENLVSADETISKLTLQLKLIEDEKSEVENRCSELQESNENLKVEITTAKNLENNPAYEKIQFENDNLKHRIFESDKIMAELKNELELAKKDQMNNICKVEELVREIEELKKENIDFSHALTTIEETQKNLADVLSDVKHDSDLTSDRIIELITQNSGLPDSETKQNKIVTNLVETITKTCKGVQNELIKKFDNKVLELENQKDIDFQNLQDQIKLLTEKNVEYEAVIKQTKDSLAVADDTIFQLKSRLSLMQTEKTELEIHRQNLEEVTLNLQAEIDTKETIIKGLDELKTVWKKIEIENDDLKQRIFESDKIMAELKNELELAKKDQMNNICKVEELVREIEELKKENIDFSHALTTIEQTQKNLADVLSDVKHDSDLTSDRIIELITQNSRLPDSETKQNKIVTNLVETITKTCKGVQNELIKKFDNKVLELENQKDVDFQNLQDQIKLLTEKNVEYEAVIKQTKDSLAVADDTVFQLKSRLSLMQTEKTELEIHRQKLEEVTLNLQAEMDTKETIIKGLDELKIVWKKIEIENGDLKQQTLESQKIIVCLKNSLEAGKEEQSRNEMKVKDLQNEIDSLKKEQEDWITLSRKLESIEKNNKNLLNVLLDIQSYLDMPEDTLTKILSGDFQNKKIFSEKINVFAKTQMEGLKAENKHLKLGIDNLKQKVKELTKLICETANNDLKEALSNLNSSQSFNMSLRSKSKNMDICVRRLDKLEEINHNLTELLTQILSITEYPDLEKLKLCSVRDFSNIMKKVVAHFKDLESKMKELKEENAQLDEECETYANIIKDLKKEAAAVWKTNKEKTEELESKISRLNEEKKCLENEKQDLLAKIESANQKLKSTLKTEEPFHNCISGSESKKINELKRAILVKEQKLLELQDLEAQINSYKSQIEYLKTALEREKKKVGEEKEKTRKLQNELNESTKNQKTENKKASENQILDELRMRGSISGGVVQEFVDKEKMRKLSKDIGILKELCRARYAEIKRLEAVNAALRNGTPKNSNQMDSPLHSRGYNTRSKNQVRDLWRTEISGKENGAL